MRATRSSVGSAAVVVALTVLVSGCATSRPVLPPQTPAPASIPAESTSAAAGASAPSPAATTPAVIAPKAKPGTIVVRGNGPAMFGPYKFKPGGYVFRFEQTPTPGNEFNETSLVVSLESEPQGFKPPYQLLSNTSKETGSNQVVVKGKLWIDVSSSANDYTLTFTPRGN